MTPAMQAHLRLLERLPKRTHEWVAKDHRIGWGQKRTEAQEQQLILELRELERQGVTRREMARICGTTQRLIQKFLGRGN